MKNKKARHDYFILSTYEAGIVLQGTEVKSIKDSKINFKDSFASVKDGELWLVGMHVSPYEKGNIFNHNPTRNRKLLMHSLEIKRLKKSTKEKGLTIVPLSVYLKNGKVKIEIGLARGKHLDDKREDAILRDAKREMEHARKKVW